MQGQPQTFSDQDSTNLRSAAKLRPEVVEAESDSISLEAPRQEAASVTNGSGRQRPTPIWLQRMSLIILVLFCVYLGVIVLILPWWSRIWDHNNLFEAHPPLAAFLHNGAVRGIISGIGLLDIWIGISEAVHYRDYRG